MQKQRCRLKRIITVILVAMLIGGIMHIMTMPTFAENGSNYKKLKIIGSKTVHIIGSSDDTIVICSGKLEDFKDFSINGKIADKSIYSIEKYGFGEGSTLLRIKSEYLETLDEHENYEGIINFSSGTLTFHFGVYSSYPNSTIGSTENEEFVDIQDKSIKLSGKLGKISDLNEIYLDNNIVEKSNYTLEEKEDSIFLTFNQDYLQTFNSSSYLKLYYYDNIIRVSVFIRKASTDKPITDSNGSVNNINGSVNNINKPNTVKLGYSFSPNCIVKNGYYGMTEITSGRSAEIVSIEIDNNILDKSVYTIIKDTATTISFDLEYLKTLSIGKHTATINYINSDENKNESKSVVFKIEEPLATGCSPECQAQIDELKTQVESLQTQLNQLQDQFNKMQNNNTSSKPNQEAVKPNNSSGNVNNTTGSNNSNLESGTTTANEQTLTPTIKNSPKTGDHILLKFLEGVTGFAISGLIVAAKMKFGK